MKTIHTNFILAAAFACAVTLAHAGFVFETSPPSQATAASRPAEDPAPLLGGRNVDTSAKLDRMTRMNRQRIDLESRLTSRISQSGDTPPELGIIRGMGRDVTLEDALRQVLPAGWTAYSDQDLPLDTKVSWSGNRTWPMVLHSLVLERDMRAHIDWKNMEVMFFVPAAKEPPLTKPVLGTPGVEVRAAAAQTPAASAASAVAVTPSAAAPSAVAAASAAPAATVAATPAAAVPTALAPSAVAATPVAAAVAGAAPVATAGISRAAAGPALDEKAETLTPKAPKVEVKEVIWTLSAEHTLRENLRRWASAANWNLVWNAVNGDSVIDYPVDAKVEFSGELLGASGAMAKVITAYRDADYPLEIEFFRGNRVVEVRLHRIPDIKAAASDPVSLTPPRAPVPPKPPELPGAGRLAP